MLTRQTTGAAHRSAVSPSASATSAWSLVASSASSISAVVISRRGGDGDGGGGGRHGGRGGWHSTGAGHHHGHGARRSGEHGPRGGGRPAGHAARRESLLRAPRQQEGACRGALGHDRAAGRGQDGAAGAGRPARCARCARASGSGAARSARAALGSRRGRGGWQRCRLAGLSLVCGRHAGLLAGGRGGDALAKLGYHQQAARSRGGRPEQPRAGADDNTGTHAARVADATLSASKGRLKEIWARRPANSGSSARNGEHR